MGTKIDQLEEVWAAGDRIGALRIASRFFDRSEDTVAFQAGMGRVSHPRILPPARPRSRLHTGDVLAALARKFKLPL
jgi:hypothetical protein